jgi:hypothetical protein
LGVTTCRRLVLVGTPNCGGSVWHATEWFSPQFAPAFAQHPQMALAA